MDSGPQTNSRSDRIAEPSILAAYHVSTDETTGQLSGSLPLDARFPVGSVTKTLGALLAARLSLDGVIAWDEPLAASRSKPVPVTLRTLLCHTAAVPFELDASHWGPTSLSETELSSALVSRPRIQLPPGTWHYSNLGYALAARILADTTGQDYPTLLAERLLQPLGMTKTSFPDEQKEGKVALGAAAPAGDLWSTLDNLATLARAIDGRRPDVVTWPMLAMLLESVTPDNHGAHLGAGIRTHTVGHHRLLVSTGTIRNRTTCIAVWPRRGASILVAEAGYKHDSLWRAAARQWQRPTTNPVRTWWLDGQAVLELRYGDMIELVLSETTWPFAIFSGHAQGDILVGVDWRGQPLELRVHGDALTGPDLRLVSDVAGSAYGAAEQP